MHLKMTLAKWWPFFIRPQWVKLWPTFSEQNQLDPWVKGELKITFQQCVYFVIIKASFDSLDLIIHDRDVIWAWCRLESSVTRLFVQLSQTDYNNSNNIPMTSGFLLQRANNAESVSVSWRNHGRANTVLSKMRKVRLVRLEVRLRSGLLLTSISFFAGAFKLTISACITARASRTCHDACRNC